MRKHICSHKSDFSKPLNEAEQKILDYMCEYWFPKMKKNGIPLDDLLNAARMLMLNTAEKELDIKTRHTMVGLKRTTYYYIKERFNGRMGELVKPAPC